MDKLSATEIHTLSIADKGLVCGFVSARTRSAYDNPKAILESDDIFQRTGFHELEYVKQIMVRAAFLEGRDAAGYFGGSVQTYQGFDDAIPEEFIFSAEPIPGMSTYTRANESVIFRPVFFSQFRSLVCEHPLLRMSEPLLSVVNADGEFWFQEMQGNGGWVTNCDFPRIEKHVAAFVSLDGIETVRNSSVLREMLPEGDPLRADV